MRFRKTKLRRPLTEAVIPWERFLMRLLLAWARVEVAVSPRLEKFWRKKRKNSDFLDLAWKLTDELSPMPQLAVHKNLSTVSLHNMFDQR